MFKNIKTKRSLTILSLLSFLIINVVVANPIDIFKLHNDNTLDLVQMTDVHLDTKTKSDSKRMVEESVNLLKDAVSQVNNLKDVEMVVFSGDVINRSDKSEFLKFTSIANSLNVPWYYAPGNHDIGILGGISKPEMLDLWLNNNKQINTKSLCFDNNNLLNKTLYYSYSPNKNFLILFMDGVITNEITAKGYFPKQELDWLDAQLKLNPDKKVIIVQHFPIIEPYKNNKKTDPNSHKVINAGEYLKTIDKYSNVIAVLSGHYHATKITQRKNVLHISTPSLIEYPNAFREIKITRLDDSTKFDIKVIETNLKNVQKLSKSRSKDVELEEGQKQDRNAIITIKN